MATKLMCLDSSALMHSITVRIDYNRHNRDIFTYCTSIITVSSVWYCLNESCGVHTSFSQQILLGRHAWQVATYRRDCILKIYS